MMDFDPRVYENVSINDNDVRNIVLSYLVHNCFKETAEALLTGTGMQQSVNYLSDLDKRKAIFHFALEGDAIRAIELTEQLAPKLLEQNEDLHFDLLGLHFVELVCSKKCTEALEFAQAKLTPFGKIQKNVEKLEDFMALLAYEEPEKSPMFHLLGSEYRQSIADNLNRAVLALFSWTMAAHANLPSYSSMERLIQQATVIRQYLHQELGKSINDNDVRNIVLSYLVHNCFKETAEALLTGTGMQQSVNYLSDLDKRKAIFHFALEGDAIRAIELTEQLAPKLLEQNEDLHFDLLGLHFVELVCSKKCTEALEFAQAKLTPFGKIQKNVEKLEDFMALLAYEEPEKSPMFHLLGSEYRQSIADNLNRAVLAHANLPSYSSMERLIQQATVIRQYLHQELGKDGPPPFSLQAFLKS
ncbi:hypothetical protein KFK09_011935 [Dendrobium nobile]|uniref:CTLH domain-containing protein n=2 Tax=Dendrobium TaxID=37818 RepID=A0A8T3BDW7_DENNO|nr:hypothetical protein KFK09_011935 [Dendrobium nobile]